MKNPHHSLVSLLLGTLACAATSVAFAQQATPITPPAVNNGSNWSRAPFPAARQFDDVKGPDGQAIDNLPPDTAVSMVPPTQPPPARIAILQSTRPEDVTVATTTTAVAPVASASASTTTTTPGLSPTGPSTSFAGSLDATAFAPQIRMATMSNREQILSDIETRISQTEQSITSMSSSLSSDARRSFNAAHDEVKSKAKALKNSVQKARKAKDQDWENARMQVASDYEAFATALGRLDTAATMPSGAP